MGKDGVLVRLLVPRRDEAGNIQYQAEMHWVRLPLRREDRLAFLQRLAGEEESYLAR
jgi:hypothetical protein